MNKKIYVLDKKVKLKIYGMGLGMSLVCVLIMDFLWSGWFIEFLIWEMKKELVSWLLFMDWLSISFLCVLLVVFFSVCYFGYSYLGNDIYYWRFMGILTIFISSMILLISSWKVWLIFIGWDGLGVSSFILVSYYGASSSWWSGLKTYLMNRWGDGFLLIGLCYMISCDSLNLEELVIQISLFILLLILQGLFTKSAQYPYSAWLLVAMAAPTPVSALVHSSTLVTAGVYLLLRFYSMKAMLESHWVCFVLGCLTVMLGSMGGFWSYDLKKIMAFSTLSQLGFFIVVLGLSGIEKCLMAVLFHAVLKAGLFIGSGYLLMKNSQDIRLMKSSFWSKIYNSYFMLHYVLSLVGLGCFVGHSYKGGVMSEMVSMSSSVIVIIWCSIVILTCLYSFRLYSKMVKKIGSMFFQNYSHSMSKGGFILVILNSSLVWLWSAFWLVYEVLSWSWILIINLLIIFGLWFSLTFIKKSKNFMYLDWVSSGSWWSWLKNFGFLGNNLEKWMKKLGNLNSYGLSYGFSMFSVSSSWIWSQWYFVLMTMAVSIFILMI